MEDEARTTWIQGASRGLGLALTREALRRDPEVTVIATARQLDGSPGLDELELRAPGRLLRFACDASDPASVEAAVSAIAAAVPRLDAIWNVAGILQEGDHRPEKRLEQVRLESLERLFGVNAFGPLLVLRAALPLLPRDRTVHLVNLSARVGSIEDNRLGGWYGYRASKAALNMFVRTAAIELRRRLLDLPRGAPGHRCDGTIGALWHRRTGRPGDGRQAAPGSRRTLRPRVFGELPGLGRLGDPLVNAISRR
jgi:NAD(P)-dependent dehydrogenase (short-subunit alcohol dehydrogenase family)